MPPHSVTATAPVRDAQRRRVYDAEDHVAAQLAAAARGVCVAEVAGSTITLPRDVVFGSLPAVQAWVSACGRAEWFATAFPRAAATPVRVERRGGDRAATYTAPDRIRLPEPARGAAWALRGLVVCHELAHHAVHHDRGGDRVAAHGPEFAGVLQHIVGAALGPEIGLVLMAAYAGCGVVMRGVEMTGVAGAAR